MSTKFSRNTVLEGNEGHPGEDKHQKKETCKKRKVITTDLQLLAMGCTKNAEPTNPTPYTINLKRGGSRPELIRGKESSSTYLPDCKWGRKRETIEKRKYDLRITIRKNGLGRTKDRVFSGKRKDAPSSLCVVCDHRGTAEPFGGVRGRPDEAT